MNVLDVQKPGLKGRTRWTQSGCGFGRPRPVTVSPSGLEGSGGGCIFRERGDWREACRPEPPRRRVRLGREPADPATAM